MRPSREVLSTLFEGAPRFVERLAARLAPDPADTYDELFDLAEQVALSMPEDEQLELLNAHPRIGAAPASVSTLSYREQGYDRDLGTAQLQDRLDALNDDYERRFGFRFVIFVNGRSRAEIADLMADHMDMPRDGEKERALRDVIAIARSRLMRIEELPRIEEEQRA